MRISSLRAVKADETYWPLPESAYEQDFQKIIMTINGIEYEIFESVLSGCITVIRKKTSVTI